MNTDNSKIKEMSPELLRYYVEMRRRVDIEVNTIFSITSMLALLETSGDDTINVDPIAIGKINQTLNKNILNIWEILDDFIYIVQARTLIEEMEK